MTPSLWYNRSPYTVHLIPGYGVHGMSPLSWWFSSNIILYHSLYPFGGPKHPNISKFPFRRISLLYTGRPISYRFLSHLSSSPHVHVKSVPLVKPHMPKHNNLTSRSLSPFVFGLTVGTLDFPCPSSPPSLTCPDKVICTTKIFIRLDLLEFRKTFMGL